MFSQSLFVKTGGIAGDSQIFGALFLVGVIEWGESYHMGLSLAMVTLLRASVVAAAIAGGGLRAEVGGNCFGGHDCGI